MYPCLSDGKINKKYVINTQWDVKVDCREAQVTSFVYMQFEHTIIGLQI
jgi:hypothetical protein